MANQSQTQPDQVQGAIFPPLVSLAPGRPPRPHPGTGQMVIIGDAVDAPSPTSGAGRLHRRRGRRHPRQVTAGGVVNRTQRIAALPCGRWTKWVVLAFWIAVVAVAGPLAGKLNGAQQNDASAWLPNNAESTQVIELAKRFTPSDIVPAVVVYELPGPVTRADQARVAADAERFAGLDHVGGKVVGPIPASDGRALEVVVPVEMGSGGWNDVAPVVEEVRSIARSGGGSVHVTGPAGYATDFADVFSGFDATLLYITAAIVIVILLLTYRSPVLWLLPLTLVFVALTAAQAVIYLLARDVGLTVNGQTAFILTVLVFGAGTDYAAAADRPLPRGAAPPRRPPRGHGGGAGPGRAGDHRQRRHGDPEPAGAAGGRAQLDQEPGPGDGGGHRGRPVRHDHPVAGAAGHLRPLGVLAAAAHRGFRRADRAWPVGPDRPAGGPPAPGRLDGDRGGAGSPGARGDPAGGQRPPGQGLLPHRARVGHRGAGAGPPLPGRCRQPGPGHRHGPGRRRLQSALSRAPRG